VSVLDVRTTASPLSRDQFVADAFSWVLEVDWSTPLRWATDPAIAVDASGNEVMLLGGLEVAFNETIEWLGEVPGEREASFVGLRVQSSLNMAELVLEGHPLAGVEALLSFWVTGTPWEQRTPVLRGVVRTPTVGGVDEPMSFTVRAERRTDLPKLPRPADGITVQTWPEKSTLNQYLLPEASDGIYYPIVYGLPGFREQRARRIFVPGVAFDFRPNSWTYGGGSPCHVVQADYDIDTEEQEDPGDDALILGLALNGHSVIHVDYTTGEIIKEPVSILNLTKSERWDDVTLLVGKGTQDANGANVTLVDLTERFVRLDDPWVVGDDLWILWDESSGSTPSDRSTLPLRGAGGVIEHALRTGGAQVDTAQWDALREELDAFLIDTYRDKPQDAWEWVAETLLPLLPIGIVDSATGISPVLWRWDVTAKDTVGHITTGQLGVERVRQPVMSEDWSNAIRVNYRPKTSGRDFDAATAVVGLPIVTDSQHPTLQTLSSTASHGEREARIVDALAIFDHSTARRAAALLAALYSGPQMTTTLDDPQRSWAHVAIGSPVLFTDSELGWDRELVWLTERSWSGTTPTFKLLRIQDPVRDF